MNSVVVPCLVVLLLARDLLRPRDITIAQELKSVSDKGTFTDSLSDSAMLGGAAARARQPHMQISEDMVWKQRYMDLRQQFDKSKQKSVHWHNASAPSVFDIAKHNGPPEAPGPPATRPPTHNTTRRTLTMHDAVASTVGIEESPATRSPVITRMLMNTRETPPTPARFNR